MSLGVKSNQSQININSLNSNSERTYEFDRFRLDAAYLMLYENNRTVSLPPKVVETLLALIEKRGEIVGKEELMNRLWANSFVEESNLVQNIYLLRKTLGKAESGEDLIETFRRRGYRFNGELKQSENDEMIFAVETRTRTVEEEIVLPDEILNGAASQPTVSLRILKPLKMLILIFLAGILLTAGIGGWRLFKRKDFSSGAPPNKSLQISLKRLTPDIYAVDPTISPDGKYMVYSKREESGRESVLLMDLATGAEKQIMPPSDGGYDSFRFSPDGSEIFLSIYGFKETQFILGRIPLAGGSPREVARDITSPFTLSPDGSQVAFVRQAELVLADSNGGNERVLARRDSEKGWFASWNSQMSWSPDNASIAICAGRLENGRKRAELLEISLADGSEHQIPVPDWDYTDDVQWLSDKTGLLVTARETSGSPFQIWLVSYPNGEARRITQDIQDYDSLSLTADSRTLIAQQSISHRNIWSASLTDTKQAKQLTFGRAANDGYYGIASMPDGRIIYTSPRSGNNDLWAMNADGSNQRQLTDKTGENTKPSATADGKFIFFVSTRTGAEHIWRMDADGGNAKQITDGEGTQSRPIISPDGNWIYYNWAQSGGFSIWKVPSEGGEPVRVSPNEYAEASSVSPDGKLLVFQQYDKNSRTPWQHGVMRIDTGETVKLFDNSMIGRINWSADSNALIYIETPEFLNLWQQPLDGTPPRQITNFDTLQIRAFDFSPDRKTLIVSRGSSSTEAILISDFR